MWVDSGPLVVGLVLGPVMERSLRQTLIISKGSLIGLWESPICMVMWFVVLLVVILPIVIRCLKAALSSSR
jgi:putative tricarboxylic transport membrane protein